MNAGSTVELMLLATNKASGTMDQYSRQVEELERRVGKSSSGLNNSMERIDNAFGILKTAAFGGAAFTATKKVTEAFIDLGKESLMAAANMERSYLVFKQAFGGNKEMAKEAISNAYELAEATPFASNQILELSSSLQRLGVNITSSYGSLGDLTKGTAMYNDITGEFRKNNVTSVSLIADLAAAFGRTGEQFGNFSMGMQKAIMTGGKNMMMLMDDLGPQTITKIWGDASKRGAMTPKAMMDAVFKYLKTEGKIGMAAAASSTFSGYIEGFKEMKESFIRNLVGMPDEAGSLFDALKKSIGQVYEALLKITKDQKFLNAIRDAVIPVMQVMIAVITRLVDALSEISKFMGNNPWTAKIIIWGAAILGVAGAFAATATAIKLASPVLSIFTGELKSMITFIPSLINKLKLLVAEMMMVKTIENLPSGLSFAPAGKTGRGKIMKGGKSLSMMQLADIAGPEVAQRVFGGATKGGAKTFAIPAKGAKVFSNLGGFVSKAAVPLAAVGAALAVWSTNLFGIQDALGAVARSFGGLIKVVKDFVKWITTPFRTLQVIMDFLTKGRTGWQNWADLSPGMQKFALTIVAIAQAIQEIMKDPKKLGQYFKDFLTYVIGRDTGIGRFLTLLEGAFEKIGNFLSVHGKTIKTVLSALGEMVLLAGSFAAVGAVAGGPVGAIAGAIGGAIAGLLDSIIKAVTGKSLFQLIAQSGFGQAIIGGMKAAFGGMVSLIKTQIISMIRTGVLTAFGGPGGLVIGVLLAFKDGLGVLADTIGQIFWQLAPTLNKIFGDAFIGFLEVFAKIGAIIQNIPRILLGTIGNIVMGIINSKPMQVVRHTGPIEALAGLAQDWIKEMPGNILEGAMTKTAIQQKVSEVGLSQEANAKRERDLADTAKQQGSDARKSQKAVADAQSTPPKTDIQINVTIPNVTNAEELRQSAYKGLKEALNEFFEKNQDTRVFYNRSPKVSITDMMPSAFGS